jgi:hypothetical protein
MSSSIERQYRLLCRDIQTGDIASSDLMELARILEVDTRDTRYKSVICNRVQNTLQRRLGRLAPRRWAEAPKFTWTTSPPAPQGGEKRSRDEDDDDDSTSAVLESIRQAKRAEAQWERDAEEGWWRTSFDE